MKEIVKVENLESLKNGFINSRTKEGFPVSQIQMHYLIAEQICAMEKWNDWRKHYRTAEEYLLHERAFIKVADYEAVCGDVIKYVAISENFPEKFQGYVDRIQKKIGAELEKIKDPKKRDNSSDLNR